MRIADTSFLFAFYHESDLKHQKAVELMKLYEKDGVLISDYILGETATLLLYRNSLEASLTFIKKAQETQTVKILKFSEPDFEGILEVFKNQKHEIGFIDASVVYLARTMGLDILSFDGNMWEEIKLSNI